jgi:hypothetical protein
MKTLFAAAAAALLLTSAPALAQEPPGGVPFGAGTQRGVQSLNNSGQTGFVTLFHHGNVTRLVTALDGTMSGRVQMVALQRGKSCDAIAPGIIARSADMKHGMSRGEVPMSENRLLSGNYLVIVYSSTMPGARQVACGQLYQ